MTRPLAWLLTSAEKCREVQINPPVYETFSDRRGMQVIAHAFRILANERFQVAVRLGLVELPSPANVLQLDTGTMANIFIMPRRTRQKWH
jgi:hypothetical protein